MFIGSSELQDDWINNSAALREKAWSRARACPPAPKSMAYKATLALRKNLFETTINCFDIAQDSEITRSIATFGIFL